jgi:LmbE family N-acetylglucosaminyl deacetylase
MPSHVYLSPHLDDAVLSCGGMIHRQRALGDSVSVVNLCAGVPDYTQLSPFAQQYHAAWDTKADPVASRRAEDKAVLSELGVTAHYLDTPDSIYRRVDGRVVYPDLATLFAEPHPEERDALPALWHQKLIGSLSNAGETVIYAPLGAGNHVDHQLGRALGLRLMKDGWSVWFYEDFSHVESPGALEETLAWFSSPSWQTQTIPIDVNAKIAAIRGYRTQIPFMFGDERTMARRVKRFTAETACHISIGERIRRRLAGLDGRRERLWRAVLGYHAHAERVWRPVR